MGGYLHDSQAVAHRQGRTCPNRSTRTFQRGYHRLFHRVGHSSATAGAACLRPPHCAVLGSCLARYAPYRARRSRGRLSQDDGRNVTKGSETNAFDRMAQSIAPRGDDCRRCRSAAMLGPARSCLPRPPHHRGRPVRARRADRHHRADTVDFPQPVARAAGRGRQPRRRRRQHRHGAGGARNPGRPHPSARLDRDRGQSGAVQEPAVRPDQGFRADLRARECAERAGGPSRIRHQQHRRPDRAREGGAASAIRARAPARSHI